MVDRREGRRLLMQSLNQFRRRNPRVAGNVVNRFFRIERHTLPAGRPQRIDHLRLHAQHAELEHREQADRPRADNRDVGSLRLIRHGCSDEVWVAPGILHHLLR